MAAKTNRGAYVYGNTARQLEVPKQQRPVRRIEEKRRTHRRRGVRLNFGFIFCFSAALLISGIVLTGYLTLKADVTNSVKEISRLEKQLNTLKIDNDERLARISSNTNLEEIRQTAIWELGMQYAQEGQIITFSSEENDYVVQKGEIPD